MYLHMPTRKVMYAHKSVSLEWRILKALETSRWLLILKFFRANSFINKFSTYMTFKPDEDLQYIAQNLLLKLFALE